MPEGWIKIHRSILDWEWYEDLNTFKLFFHMLVKANHKDKKWRGREIKRGQFISSSLKLSEETRLTRQQIRTSISRLKSTNEITSKSSAQHTVFTVNNYDKYQEANQLPNQLLTNEQPATNQLLTTTKNVKNNKNEKNDKNITPPKSPPGGTQKQSEGFDEFWSAYPNKKGKGQALRAWSKIKPDQILINTILMAVRDQIEEKELLTQHGKFCPEWKNPSTWLNGQCWEDGLSTDFQELTRQKDLMAEWLGESNVIKGEFHARD